MRFSETFLDDLRTRVSIVDLVSEYVQLSKKGGKYWGICPFHGEKTASFSVDEQREMFYCFGCHKGGNAFTFLMETERMDFTEAVEEIARRAGVAMPVSQGKDEKDGQLRKAILEANRAAAQYYHSLLWEEGGKPALSYLYGRGIDDKTIKKFGLGVSPGEWQALYAHLSKAGFADDVLLSAGLVNQKNERIYDAFRGRLMFPIINIRDQVLGFGGRIMAEGEPKYLNTSDTKAFFKRQGLYALNIAKRLRNLDTLYLVEGYMDVIGLYQKGVGGAVATLGTALTPEQCRLLSRFVSKVTICYDGDAAGRQATLRALEIFEPFDMDVRVLSIPGGLDPDEYVKEKGKDGFLGLPAMTSTRYRMERCKDDRDLSLLEDRTAYAIDCAKILKQIKNPVEVENYITQLMTDTGFSRDVLRSQISATAESKRPQVRRAATKSAALEEYEKAEKIILCALAMEVPRDIVKEEDFISEGAKSLARQLLAGKKPGNILSEIENEAQRNAAASILAMELKCEDSQELLQVALQSVAAMRASKLDIEMDSIMERLTGCDEEEKNSLMQKLISMGKEKHHLEAMKGRVVTLEQ